ncbi:MAG: hypothetical protein ABSB61_01320 [Anaerolineales bacterium]
MGQAAGFSLAIARIIFELAVLAAVVILALSSDEAFAAVIRLLGEEPLTVCPVNVAFWRQRP